MLKHIWHEHGYRRGSTELRLIVQEMEQQRGKTAEEEELRRVAVSRELIKKKAGGDRDAADAFTDLVHGKKPRASDGFGGLDGAPAG